MQFPIEAPELGRIPADFQPSIQSILARSAPSPAPTLLHTLGGPGSGKSLFVKALRGLLPDTAAFLAFDALMESVPDYREADDKIQAFARYELPARQVGYALLRELIGRKADIVFEHSGARADHVELLRFARENGYQVLVVHLHCDAPLAHARLEKRQALNGRYTPPHYVEEREALLAELVPAYKATADHYLPVLNEGGEAVLQAAAVTVAGLWNERI